MVGSLRLVKLLIYHGADANLLIGRQPTNLLLYILKDLSHLPKESCLADDIIQCLINDAQINTDTTDNNGDSVAHYLAASAKLNILKLLSPTELSRQNKKNWTTMHFAVERQHYYTAMWLAKHCSTLIDVKSIDDQDLTNEMINIQWRLF